MRYAAFLAIVPLIVSCSSSSTNGEPSDATSIESGGDAGGDTVVVGDGGCVDFVAPTTCQTDPDTGLPTDLACTGLYGDFSSKTIACGLHEFAPGYELWSDGAKKTRWISLPDGQKIDDTNADQWTFPVGTKLFKQFEIPVAGGAFTLVETRLFNKQADGWHWGTYVWSDDGTTATLNSNGVKNVRGTTYEIPTHQNCSTCHGAGRFDRILGFESFLMSVPTATGFTFAEAKKAGVLLVGATPAAIPGNDVERAALGYLHANCGIACHNPQASGSAQLSGLYLRIEHDGVATVQDTNAFKTAMNKTPGNNFPGQPAAPAAGAWYDVRPGDLVRSLLVARMETRDLTTGGRGQMPPIITHVVDANGVSAVKAWIQSMSTANGYPAPAP